ncbi:hypothetical protein Pnap_0659 [Polaromonas naphthalenivorans CJ2]|uniref:Uncharacterized protein n=1 Tax=Polaromonas naphthalenivorans (strain CJ2) TaxID=365044 RepID=A1VK00_POLNA|nr:hypothetical protein Pnap_0659 [Polaromonas naphthalenivorans CJ2]
MSSDSHFLKERLAEAARYALMRRLLPAIRHNLAGSLQPIGMMSAMLERRIKSAAPDMAQLGKNTQALTTLSREAVATSQNLMAWLGPRDNDVVALNGAVEESLGLMSTELSFRGFCVVNQTAEVSAELPKGILRSVFTASLIALTDSVEEAASVVVSAAGEAGDTRLKIAIEPGGMAELASMGSRMPTYRLLQWADVQALADAEGVHLDYAPDFVQLDYCAAATVLTR